jgi:hypothetical protein
MREIVRQGRIYVCQFEVVLACDFVGAPSVTFVPDSNMLYGNTASCNARLSPENLGPRIDPLVECL